MNIVEVIKAIVGPMIVLIVAWLAYSIINGNVTERNSFGLNGVIAIISGLSAAYGLWAYGYTQSHTSTPPDIQKAGSSGNKPEQKS